ncbi:lysophospholipid acyltransferase family protein [Sulfurivirga caldicuralii]|nr:lysophospholipid acyltransferase family protein [Sulfurivirga caldicuralii]
MRNSTVKPNTPKFERHFLHPRYWPLWLAMGLLRLLALLPHKVKLKLGSPLGNLLYWLAPQRRKLAAANIALSFPDWSAEKHHALLRAHFRSLGIGMMELLIVWWGGYRREDDRKERALVTFHNLDIIKKLQAEGRGVIMLVPHFTHIDMTGLFLQLELSYAPVYRPHDDPLMEYLITKGRTVFRDGAPWVTPISKDASRTMLKHLKRGGLLFYLPDQRYRNPKQRVDATFFGRPAPSNPATSKLAQLTGAAVVPVFTRRINDHYHVTCLPPVDNFPSGDDLADTERLHRLYEQEIRHNPAQYLWVHDRWNLSNEDIERLSSQA